MVYIYDILVNFNDSYLFDFFEWNMNDGIDNLKKVRLYRISSHSMDDLMKNQVCVDHSFLEEIFKTCEVYTKNSVRTFPYVCLFSDGIRVLAIEWSSDGVSSAKSKLILEEEEDVLEIVEDMKLYDLPYNVISLDLSRSFLTRKELKIRKYLKAEIEDAYHGGKYEKLKFLYGEYFEKEIDSYQRMEEELLASMEYFLDSKHVTLYELLRLSHKKKQV
ncbi:MAG: DUF3603 family protein [Bacilli bacterium]|nr:DUF3603 family protein [Bacilli bacterium]